ncbi:hypothetical protein C8R47DRAFT_1224212 [Mycena vitilis]|nr:hypothetical protein C8R47DRAFT_1224212 [Mycena vitilis]
MSSAEGVTAAEASESWRSQPGMDKGYAMSKMADIRREYLREPVDEPSLMMRVTAIVGKRALDVHEVMDRGVSSAPDTPLGRFALETGFNLRTERTIVDMQSLLRRASALVEGRQSCFVIDPHRTMMTLLRGARELSELHVAWVGLSRRMELSQKYLDKYESEFRGPKEEDVLLSPVSTAPEIYAVFPRDKGPASDVNYMFDHVPHLQTLLPKDYDKETGWLPHHLTAPNYLEQAFPDRSPELKPSTVYFSAEGERREITISARSSRGSPGDFELPPAEDPPHSRRERVRSPIKDKRSRDRHREKGAKQDTAATTVSSTPFKVSSAPFVPRSPSNRAYGLPSPGQHLPNPLVGMASALAAPYPLENDSISGYKGKGRADAPREGQWGAGKTSMLSDVPELDEASFQASRGRRDPPPHLAGSPAWPSSKPDEQPQGRNQRRGSRHSRQSSRQGRREESQGHDSRAGSGRQPDPPSSRNQGGVERGRQPRQEGAGGGGPSDDSSDSGDGDDRRRDRRDRPPPRRRRTPVGHRRGRSPSPPGDPSDDGSGEGSEDDYDRDKDGRYAFPYVAPGAPYGTMVPTIEPKLKVESLPEWDGEHDTAVDYFWAVNQVANLEGWLPRALGFWLPSRLKRDSQVYLWFSTLPTSRQAEMRSHYLVYLQVIKDRYLGKRWQLLINLQFEAQSFRQEGYENESPQLFLGRRTKYVRLLGNSDEGGPAEVFLIMHKAPIAWSTIVVLENIKTTEELYERVNEHEDELVEASTRNGPEALTTKNLAATLRRLGFSSNGASSNSKRPFRRANLTEVDVPETVQEEVGEVEAQPAEDAKMDSGPLEDVTVRQAFQILKRKQRPPPKGGYKFAKNDHVTTKMGKAPPSPCKVCGSANHWDRECPDWDTYLERQRRGALLVSRDEASDEAELIYHSAYSVLREHRITDSSF